MAEIHNKNKCNKQKINREYSPYAVNVVREGYAFRI